MTNRDAFLKALAANEDDLTTRLVYADWLDEHDEYEEADRQRKWPAAKEWLVRFCAAHNPSADEGDDYTWVISYKDLLDIGREAVERSDEEGFGFSCGNNMEMCDALRNNAREFWTNWSIVTGVPLPPDVEEKSSFRCAC